MSRRAATVPGSGRAVRGARPRPARGRQEISDATDAAGWPERESLPHVVSRRPVAATVPAGRELHPRPTPGRTDRSTSPLLTRPLERRHGCPGGRTRRPSPALGRTARRRAPRSTGAFQRENSPPPCSGTKSSPRIATSIPSDSRSPRRTWASPGPLAVYSFLRSDIGPAISPMVSCIREARTEQCALADVLSSVVRLTLLYTGRSSRGWCRPP